MSKIKRFFKTDIFGQILLGKKLLMSILGLFTYPGLNWLNKLNIEGTEHLEHLKDKNVLFVSNHQTYFADVFAISHVFCSIKWRFKNKISNPLYLLSPRINTYFIAAEETMKAGLLTKIFSYAGCVSIKRTWREAGKDINRQVNFKDISNIGLALSEGWVITFPQGTTTAFAKGRRGTSHIIKKFQPVVVPVVIDGFGKAFYKKKFKLKNRRTRLSVKFKAPLTIDYQAKSDAILEQLMVAIEQSAEFQVNC